MKLSPTKNLSQNQKGFTVLELLVTVAIVGILSVIATTGYKNYRNKAKIARGKVILSGLYSTMKASNTNKAGFNSSEVYKRTFHDGTNCQIEGNIGLGMIVTITKPSGVPSNFSFSSSSGYHGPRSNGLFFLITACAGARPGVSVWGTSHASYVWRGLITDDQFVLPLQFCFQGGVNHMRNCDSSDAVGVFITETKMIKSCTTPQTNQRVNDSSPANGHINYASSTELPFCT